MIKKIILLWLLLFSMSSLSAFSDITFNEFNYVTPSSFQKTKKIAVICGQRKRNLLTIAEIISEMIPIFSKMEVVTPETIIKFQPNYPSNTLKNTASINLEDSRYSTSGYLSEEDIGRVITYTESIKADYVFLVFMGAIKRGFEQPDPPRYTSNYRNGIWYTEIIDPADTISGYYFEITLYCRLIETATKKVSGYHNITQHLFITKNKYDSEKGIIFCFSSNNLETQTYRHGMEEQVIVIDWLLKNLAKETGEQFIRSTMF